MVLPCIVGQTRELGRYARRLRCAVEPHGRAQPESETGLVLKDAAHGMGALVRLQARCRDLVAQRLKGWQFC